MVSEFRFKFEASFYTLYIAIMDGKSNPSVAKPVHTTIGQGIEWLQRWPADTIALMQDHDRIFPVSLGRWGGPHRAYILKDGFYVGTEQELADGEIALRPITKATLANVLILGAGPTPE